MAEAGDGEERYHLRVLRLGKVFTHTLREWPVFSVDLRVIEFCVLSGFRRAAQTLGHSTNPVHIVIVEYGG